MMPNETTNTPILTLDSDAKLETAQSISDLLCFFKITCQIQPADSQSDQNS